MDLSAYQEKALTTALYPNVGQNPYYPALGLGGEVGEVLNKVKKIMRDNDGNVTDELRDTLKSELGDVLWYVAALASELKINLDDVARCNIDKLKSRNERGVIKGSGDQR